MNGEEEPQTLQACLDRLELLWSRDELRCDCGLKVSQHTQADACPEPS